MSPTTKDRLLAWRSEFPTLESTLHFISHSLGAMPRGVDEALRRYTVTWRSSSIRAWEEEWWTLPTEVGNAVARIIGAAPGSVSMHENVTMAQAVALSAVDFTGKRNRLVCTSSDFPSVLYLYEGLSQRGADIVRVEPDRDGLMREEDIARAVDERTAVLAVSHTLFRTSQVLDLALLCGRCRDVGALSLIDAYQSVGTYPLNVDDLGVDMLTGGSVKWLCGGPGAGYLYVRPDLAARLEPALTGWFAHVSPLDFDPCPIRRDPGSRRFWTGTPAIPAFVAARTGYEMVADIGIEPIRAKSLRQTDRMIEQADALGLRVVSPRRHESRGGTVVLDVPSADRVCAALLAQDVLLDFRPGVGLRLGPHFYTRDDEVDEVMRRVAAEVGKLSG